MTLSEITGKRVSAFSREHRPAENGGENHVWNARVMDAIDGDLDLVCNWSNCRKTLAVLETTTRPDQTVTYRRGVAREIGAPFFHIQEVRMSDGSWRYRNVDPECADLLTMDEWVERFEVPLRQKHGCKPWEPTRRGLRICATYAECDNYPEMHCAVCWHHKDAWWADCPIHGVVA